MNERVSSGWARLKTWPRWVRILAPALAVGVLILVSLRRGASETEAATFPVTRGSLNISVIEGGTVRAVESQEIKCEVRASYQGLKILKIVEEGYEVTAEDIRTNKVLVELDSSELEKQIVQQDIQYESAAASLTDAQQNYEIQLNQNLSDIKAAEQKARFARMDFDKLLGDNVTVAILAELGLERAMAQEEQRATAQTLAVSAPRPAEGVDRLPSAAAPMPLLPDDASALSEATVDGPDVFVAAPASVHPAAERPSEADGPSAPEKREPPPEVAPDPMPTPAELNLAEYASVEVLGDGEAKQKLRKFDDDLQVALKEEGQAKATLEGTKRLFEKGFVTRIDLERDEIAYENSRLKVQTASTARDLYLKYEFTKTAEEALSKYTEAVRELSRARKAAVSRLAQAQAKLKSAQGQFEIQSRQRKDLAEQLAKCVITATKPGLVVYGRGGDEMMFFGGEERIREGATVRQQQSIITIPDMSRMSVRMRVPESYIKNVKKGQKARITVDAFPDKIMEGEVTSVGVLPDSQNMWMNPDMKVYLTTVTLTGTNEWLRPGMSAKVEILVKRLDDVLYVPIQAVAPLEGKHVCHVAGLKSVRREVEIGDFNDEFIEIRSGLMEGERVLLRPTQAPVVGAKGKTPEEPTPAPGGEQVAIDTP